MYMSTLPTHPRTGLTAVGWRKPRRHHGEVGIQPIWPIAGAEDDPPPADSPKDPPKPVDPPVNPSKSDLPDPKPGDRTARSEADTTDWVAEAQKWEKRAKDNSGAAEELQKIKDAQKSEIERERDGRTAAEKERDAAKSEALRYRIAAKNHISDEDADLFLTGSDEDTLNKQAERYVALQGTKQTSGPVVPRSGTGDGTPNSGSVSAGRDMYKPRAKKE